MKKFKKHTVIVLLPVMLFLFAFTTINNLKINVLSFSKNSVVAHRGAWKSDKFPQNSIASLKKAIELKCTGSEFDVRMTSDGILVINHDPEFNGLNIEKSTFKELSKFKLSNGESLPTFKKYLKAGIKNNITTQLVCEIKPSEISKERGQIIATKVVQVVSKLKAQDMITYISFDYGILKKIIALNPKATTQYLEGNKSPEELKADGITGADYHFSVYQKHPDWIKIAKENNITLNAWTVNEASEMDWLLANDFDFITTNEPELLLERLKLFSQEHKNYKLVWSDEFNYSGLPDSTKWNYDVGGNGWGNNELEFYKEKSIKNSYVKDGILHIAAVKEEYENKPYTSARLTTFNRFSLQYGKIEVMAKLPEGKGTWPAIWMLPNSITTGEGWPLCGEIDIMEHVGKDPNVVHVSLHSKLYNHIINTQVTHFEKVSNVFNSFHLYGIEWTPDFIKFYIDNKLFYEAKKGENGHVTTNEGWPFEKPYFLILNLAMGGNWGGEVDNTIFPCEMQVDYVRMYQKTEN